MELKIFCRCKLVSFLVGLRTYQHPGIILPPRPLCPKNHVPHAMYNAYLLTYLLTPWSRVLLEKLTGSQLVKKFPSFYESRRFVTAFTNARHLPLF